MNKYVYTALLAVGLSIPAFAGQSAPVDTKGGVLDSRYAGVSTCEIANASGTNAVLCTTGSGIILDIYGSSVAATDTIVIRDSATANTTSTVLFAVDKTSIDKANRVFPRFKNGLSANLLVAATAAGTGPISRPNWTIVYVKDLN